MKVCVLLIFASSEAIGLNRIFTHREEEIILHAPDLEKELAKEQHPDRIYGLRQTRNFEETLYSHANTVPTHVDTLVRDLVNVSPLSPDGDPLLFPFLILEAKSGKSEDDWHSIKLQTAFPIRASLDVQNSVRLASGADCRWKAGPLVWFFMNKGSDWQLCAAYIQESLCTGRKSKTLDYVWLLPYSQSQEVSRSPGTDKSIFCLVAIDTF